MPILRALSTRSTPATAAQLERVAGAGTGAGIRRALGRLADHGVCLREEAAGRSVYSLNYDHVLYPAVVELLKADRALLTRLRSALRTWDPVPCSAVLFGSAARRDGDSESDIDVLLVRPIPMSTTSKRDWVRQVHELRSEVHRQTGNRLQVVDWTPAELRRYAASREPLIDELLTDGVTVHGTALNELLARAS